MMTNEQINTAIAEACGKRAAGLSWDKSGGYFCTDPTGNVFGGYPPYTTCLNACAAMEETLTEPQHDAYRDKLKEICLRDWMAGKHYTPFPDFANSRQRCESFLRVRGLWRDEP